MSLPLYSHVGHIVSRRTWVCCECGGLIQPMDVYERFAGVWDTNRRPQRFRTCQHCEETRDWLLNETNWLETAFLDTGVAFFFEHLRQHLLDQAQHGQRKDRIPALRRVVEMNRRRTAAKHGCSVAILETEALKS